MTYSRLPPGAIRERGSADRSFVRFDCATSGSMVNRASPPQALPTNLVPSLLLSAQCAESCASPFDHFPHGPTPRGFLRHTCGVPQTTVFFHAHPDDEAIFTGGTIARLAAAGHRVVVLVATGGSTAPFPARGWS